MLLVPPKTLCKIILSGSTRETMSRATEKDIAMTRKRDERIDKKIGSMIRMQRLKLGMSSKRSGNMPCSFCRVRN